MAFKGSRLAILEWLNITSSKFMWVVIAAIAAMPLLYGALYLAAFSDPYERLNTVPVAVVNEDTGALIDGEHRNLGDELVDEIKDNEDGLKWNFTNASAAQQGIEDGTYYMVCTIPSDFSQNVASADSSDPQAALLSVSYNESKNMLASQIGESVWKEVRKRVSNEIGKTYWKTMLKGLGETGDDLQKAADGAEELADGLTTAQEGAGKIADGAQELKAGEAELGAGLGKLSSGAKKLQSQGTKALASGTKELATSTKDLPSGLDALASGAHAVAKGLEEASSSIGNSKTAGKTLAYTSATVTSGLGTLSDGLDSAKQGVDATNQALNTLADAAQSGALTNSQIASRLRLIASQQEQISMGLATMKGSVGSATTPGNTLAYGANSVTQGLDALSAGVQKAQAGAGKVADGADKLAGAAPELAVGIQSLKDGASQVDSNMSTLVAGAAEAKVGADKLTDGAAQLSSGAASLEEGLTPAVDGATELGEKLAEGAQKAKDQDVNREAKAEMMSNPVELVKDKFTSVKNYGTGFAPYFMALGLWVGALVAGFVFKPLNRRAVLSGGSPLLAAFSSFLPMAFFSLIQATLLMVVLQFGLQLQIDNVPLFYTLGYLTAIVFAAIMQLLSAALGFPGKFLAIILLMLQLTSCAGTFPIETTPDFFQAIYPFMPMTYVVEGMRQIMTGFNYALVAKDFIVIVCIGLGAFILTCVVAYRKKTLRMDDLHPILQLGG